MGKTLERDFDFGHAGDKALPLLRGKVNNRTLPLPSSPCHSSFNTICPKRSARLPRFCLACTLLGLDRSQSGQQQLAGGTGSGVLNVVNRGPRSIIRVISPLAMSLNSQACFSSLKKVNTINDDITILEAVTETTSHLMLLSYSPCVLRGLSQQECMI